MTFSRHVEKVVRELLAAGVGCSLLGGSSALADHPFSVFIGRSMGPCNIPHFNEEPQYSGVRSRAAERGRIRALERTARIAKLNAPVTAVDGVQEKCRRRSTPKRAVHAVRLRADGVTICE